MRILITGSNGQIGWELARVLPSTHEIVGLDRSHLDLGDTAAIRRTLRELHPNLIVNAAGYTAVDRAETEPELALAINGTAVGVIGEEAKRLGAAVIHYSTDYVFDGTKRTPYKPNDQTSPQSAYGRSKLAGEKALLESGATAVILRTSWVYGLRGKNFLLTILNLAKTKPELRIVNDQIGSPTWSRSIAKATAAIIERSVRVEEHVTTFSGHEGIFHLTSSGSTTWHGFAARMLELSGITPKPHLTPISTEAFGAPAKRPAFSVLDCRATETVFGVRLPAWDADLNEVMRERRSAF